MTRRTPERDRESKICHVCGREIEWRKKWERDWDHVKYCSSRCRSRRRDERALALERTILDTLARRAGGATICPSEVARAASLDEKSWRELLEPTREAARRLAAAGKLEMTRDGRAVDPSTARGPIRLRLARHRERSP